MQRYTTVLKSTNDDPNKSLPNRSNIYTKNSINSAKSSNESSSSPLNSEDTNSSDTNNETITLTNSNTSNLIKSNSPKFRPANGRRFFGKSKSAAVSRSSSSNRLMAEQIYINSSDDRLSTSETDELDSDDGKLVYKTCLESPVNNIYLKKSLSRPECVMKNNFQYASIDQPDSNRRFMKNNRLKTSKSMSHYKNASFQNNDHEDEEEDEEKDDENLFYYKLDGRMKTGKLSRFKVIKSKSNSTLQPIRANLNKNYDYEPNYQNGRQNTLNNNLIKGNKNGRGSQKDDQITSQLQLNELAERLKFIERKLIENEMNTEKKFKNMSQNINNTSSYQPQQNHHPYSQQQQQQNKENNNQQNISHNNHQVNPPNYSQINFRPQQPFQMQKNQDDFSLKNGQFNNRIYPSISFGDCSEINLPNKSQKKSPRNFFSSAKLSVKNSKSIPSLFIPNNKDKNEKTSIDKLMNLPGSKSSLKNSTKTIWKPLNILSNLVDDKILKGRWSSSKSVKSSSSSTGSIRSNSICSTSNLNNNINKRLDHSKPITYAPIFNRKDQIDSKSLSNKFLNNLSSNFNSRKSSSQTNQSNGSSNCDLVRSTESNNSSRFSSNKQLNNHFNQQSNQLNPPTNLNKPKTRAFSTPNEEIFNLLSLPFLDDEKLKAGNDLDSFDNKVKQSKSYKEINSGAIKEIEDFERFISNKFANN